MCSKTCKYKVILYGRYVKHVPTYRKNEKYFVSNEEKKSKKLQLLLLWLKLLSVYRINLNEIPSFNQFQQILWIIIVAEYFFLIAKKLTFQKQVCHFIG